MEQTHDLTGLTEMSMADHFGGSGDVEVDLIEVLDFLDAPPPYSIGFLRADVRLDVSFLHAYSAVQFIQSPPVTKTIFMAGFDLE